MSKKTTIPASIEEAQTALDGLGKLLTAKEWERAAIVYAFTRDGEGGATEENRSTSTTVPMTPRQFAALGIAGLKSDRTVREYRKAWQVAIDDGQAVAVKPGDTIELPIRDWPPTAHYAPGNRVTKTEVVEGFRKMVEEDPKAAVRDLIQDSPTTISKLAKGVRTNPAIAALASTPSLDEAEEERVYIPREPDGPDYSADLRGAANRLQRVLSAMRDRRWEPDGAVERTLLTFLGLALTEVMGPKGHTDVIDEIEQFLQKEAQR